MVGFLARVVFLVYRQLGTFLLCPQMVEKERALVSSSSIILSGGLHLDDFI